MQVNNQTLSFELYIGRIATNPIELISKMLIAELGAVFVKC